MGQELLEQLVDFVKSAAPVVWEAAYRQAWVAGIQQLIGGVVCLGLLYACIHAIVWDSKQDDGDGVLAVLGSVFGFGFGLGAVILIIEAIGILLNPTWVAIQELLKLVK